MNESIPQIQKRPIGAYIIMALSVISLPFGLYLATHPKAGHVPPSMIALPVGMFGVGLDMAFPEQIWRRLLRWASVILFVVGGVGTVALWYIQSQSSTRGFQVGNDPGQYAPQNAFSFIFVILLFLYASPSEKIRQIFLPFVWFGFFVMMFFLCVFVGLGLSAMFGSS